MPRDMTSSAVELPLMALVGSTASGKTSTAIELAREFAGLELVSIDSMTVYRSMDIGTAKPTPEELKAVRYHLLNTADPWEEYSVSRFQSDAREVLAGISERNGAALLVGGTGLYYQALVDELEFPGQWPKIRAELEAKSRIEDGTLGLYDRLVELDPDGARKIEPNNTRRIVRALEVTLGSGIPYSRHGPGLFAKAAGNVRPVGIDLPRKELYGRIEKRLDSLMEAGWVDEVRRLIDDPRGASRTARQALGYKEIIGYLEGETTLDEARVRILARTKRFARRQIAWFKRDARIEWFDSPDKARTKLVSIVSDILETQAADN